MFKKLRKNVSSFIDSENSDLKNVDKEINKKENLISHQEEIINQYS